MMEWKPLNGFTQFSEEKTHSYETIIVKEKP